MGAEFVRFVVPTWAHRESQAPIGVIGAAYDLLDEGPLSHELHDEMKGWIGWFEENMPVPERFNRTKSKGGTGARLAASRGCALPPLSTSQR